MFKQIRDDIVLEKGTRPKSKRHTRLTIEHPCSDVEGDSPALAQPCFGTNHPDSPADVSRAGARTRKEVWASEVLSPKRTCRSNDDESESGRGINPTPKGGRPIQYIAQMSYSVKNMPTVKKNKHP